MSADQVLVINVIQYIEKIQTQAFGMMYEFIEKQLIF